jgi:ATP-dependent Lon protease
MKLFETNLNHIIPEILPIIPTIDVVAFPHMIIPLLIIDEKIIAGINQAIENGNKLVMVVACKKQPNAHSLSIGAQDLYEIGTIAQIIKIMPDQDGGTKILIQGISRAKISNIKISSILSGTITPLLYKEIEENDMQYIEKITTIKTLINNLSQINNIHKDTNFILSKTHQPDKIAEFILSHLTLNVSELQKMLETKSYHDFFDLSIDYLIRENEIIKIQQKAKNKARESMNHTQKEFYLREQIRALKEELGDSNEEIDNFRQKLYAIEDIFPKESFKEILQCINRLENMSAESAEAGILKTYLEYVFDLPWESETKDNINIYKAKKILDEEHYGLHYIKERILDYLSVRQLSKNALSTILCLYGPPGVGKTSLAESIAKSMGRKCFRISVGGMKDEAEIRGHRRTYVGAMPGRLIKGLKQTQSKNPVVIIDEIDKISSEFRGDPASALLEVFDYKQNNAFYDYYLGIPFDLSKILFITTANNIENISVALRDRMEMIELSSYSFEEKKHIAKNHLIKKGLKECGLNTKQINLSDEVLSTIINRYTYEAGIRDLERSIKKLFYKIARVFIETNKTPEVSPANLEKYLGAPRFFDNEIQKIDKIGVSNGLCYTSCGGEILYIETIIVRGTGKFILTGQLGEVMKESAQIAYNLIRAQIEKFSIPEKTFTEFDIHIHVPAGAIPKDGPSAGVALFSSMLSAIKKCAVKSNYAMTGEIDLQGLVLPVGGIKEKILAAKKNGIQMILLPKNNKYDVLDIAELISGLEIIYIDTVYEAIGFLFKEVLMNQKKIIESTQPDSLEANSLEINTIEGTILQEIITPISSY